MKKILSPPILLLLAGAILFAGCAQSQTPPTPAPATQTPLPDTIRIITDPLYGQILADMNGRTLYYFAKDAPGYYTTACNGSCAATWPAFDASPVRVSPPLEPDDFGGFTRPDGAKQTVYMGWPLYYYSGDKVPRDTKGYGFNRLWYVMSPGGVVTLAPTTTIPTTPATTPPNIYYGGGGGGSGGGY
jgi:predicted lipoprotein with Yx(FWY)xxD motif